MTTLNPVLSKKATRKHPFNENLFKIVNCLDLDQFKKFTNFGDLLQESLKRTAGSVPQRFSLDDRIRHHFKRNVPDEDKWRRGLFKDLRLTDEFCYSEFAKQIFNKIHGSKECESEDFEEQLHLSSRQADVSKKKIGPASKVQQWGVVYVEDETEELPIQLPADDTSETAKPKPKHSTEDSRGNTTQGLLRDLTDTDPQPILTIVRSPTKQSEATAPPERPQDPSSKAILPTIKPRAGPKSVMLNRQQLQLSSPKELSDKSMHTGSSIEPRAQESSNIAFTEPKPKIGLKSRMGQPKSSSIDLNVKTTQMQDLLETLTNDEPRLEPLQTTAVDQSERPQAPSSKVSSSTAKRSIGPKSVMLRNNINRSIERAQQHLTSYFAATDRSVQSVKHFWNDFLKFEFEDDSSGAETQLSLDDDELEAKSQAILRPDQFEAVQSAHQSYVQQEIKIKVEVED